MKNHKGEITTLLTLGLVLVGGVVTLALSYISNSQKNIASVPRASTVNCIYDTGNFCRGECGGTARCPKCTNNKYRCPGTTDDSSSGVCTARTIATCTTTNNCPGTKTCNSTGTAWGACVDKPRDGCPSTSSTAGTENNTCRSSTPKCNTGLVCNSSNICKKSSATGSAFTCSEGTAYQGVGCYDLCAAKGLSYIPSSQGTGTDGKNYCCCGGGISGVDGYPADDSCWIIKCINGEPSKVQYSDSLSKYEMPLSSCQGGSVYSGGGLMAIGSANADKQLSTLSCSSGNEETFTDPDPEPEENPPSNSCFNFGSASMCLKECKLEDPPGTCLASSGSTVKKWCCSSSSGASGVTVTKTRKTCPNSNNKYYWESNNKYYSSQTDTTGDSNFNSICGITGNPAIPPVLPPDCKNIGTCNSEATLTSSVVYEYKGKYYNVCPPKTSTVAYDSIESLKNALQCISGTGSSFPDSPLDISGNCVSQKCVSGLEYFYKCTSPSVGADGVAKCARYTYFLRKDCTLEMTYTPERYCESTSLQQDFIAREITARFRISVNGNIQVPPDKNDLIFEVYNSIGWATLGRATYKIGVTNFPVDGVFKLKTSSNNTLKWSLIYTPAIQTSTSSVTTRTVPGTSPIINNEAIISAVLNQ